MAQRGKPEGRFGDTNHLSELRIVLLGSINTGKSSAGNTILNREEFELKRTAQCVKRQREVAGRRITVVEAPGWWSNKPVEESTELLKQEIVLSVSLCPPGPHALLLIIRLNTIFIEREKNALEGHMKLLLEKVWSHTIVLFTHGDCLGDTPIEQHIESEGKELQWLVEKCGNRYHVLNNENRSDDTQVTELLEKIEEMVAANSGSHFELDRKTLQEVEKRRMTEKRRSLERLMKVQKQREYFRSQIRDAQHLSELRIVLLGYRDAGKSSAGNTILNREEFELKRTAQCVKRQREVAGRHITVVEAPGWWRDVAVEESTELLKQEIVLSVSLCPPGPHALLLAIRLDTIFRKNERKALVKRLKPLSKKIWRHTIVLFTFGDHLGDTPIEQHIESEGKELQWLVEKCGNRYHVLNNQNRSDDTQVTELLEKIEEMVAASSGHHFKIKGKIFQKVNEKKTGKKMRAKERMMNAKKQREDRRSKIRHSSTQIFQQRSELRIVLLGNRYSGKSSAGNTILNREEFELKRTAQCVKRQRNVAGRHITVVEAPGWWKNEPVELLKQEIMLSVSLCPPGPHALLIVIRSDTLFKKNEKKALKKCLKLFSDNIWSHTIVLFTYGDCLGDTPIEQHIESEGKELQWLVEKCGNRYHVLNNENRNDDTQVTELLEKIEEMVAANSGRHFEQRMEKKRRQKGTKFKARRLRERLQCESCSYQSFSGRITYAEYEGICEPPAHNLIRFESWESGICEPLAHNLRRLEPWKSERMCLRKNPRVQVKINATGLTGCSPPFSKANVQPCQQPSTDAEIFIPEIMDLENKISNSYRFLCPHAGQFQCKVTSLVFEMEDEGEVLYRIDSWDARLLDGLGPMKPAGPLYDIDCFEGSISGLHLPHCEIQYGENQDELAVAHFTCDNIEVIPPLNVTHTHVVISIQGLSFFGLLKRMISSASLINGQVLLFYKEITGKQTRKKLNVHLLPGNVPVEEVKNRHMDFRNINTSSKCQLIPGKKYRPSCDPYVFQPKVETFDCDYGPNYHPTFEVFLDLKAENLTIGLLSENGQEIWEPRLIFLTDYGSEAAPPKMDSVGTEFVDENREILIQKVPSVMETADCLQSKNMITDEMYNIIQTAKTSQEQMRILYRALDSGGTAVKEEFYEILKKKLPFLVDELEAGPSKA
ncbi:hypothetical protein MHYP_G00276280 [Metynnis hypsauchen]